MNFHFFIFFILNEITSYLFCNKNFVKKNIVIRNQIKTLRSKHNSLMINKNYYK